MSSAEEILRKIRGQIEKSISTGPAQKATKRPKPFQPGKPTAVPASQAPALAPRAIAAAAEKFAAAFPAKLRPIAEAGWKAGYNSVGTGPEIETWKAAYRAGRAARLAELGGKTKTPTTSSKPGSSTGLELIEDHFDVPHSGNDGGPFCEYGQVWYDHGAKCYRLGLRFVHGKRFLYCNESFDSAQSVVLSMQSYASASWATNPRSKYFDGRFAKGNYRAI